MGWVEGALAEAADLRGVSTLLTDLIDRPEWVHELLEICTEMEIAFARAQIAAAPISSAWGMPSPRRSRRRRTASSRCPTSSASSPRSARWARSRGCTSAATRHASWPTWRRAAQPSSISTGWSTCGHAAEFRRDRRLRQLRPRRGDARGHAGTWCGRPSTRDMAADGACSFSHGRLRDPGRHAACRYFRPRGDTLREWGAEIDHGQSSNTSNVEVTLQNARRIGIRTLDVSMQPRTHSTQDGLPRRRPPCPLDLLARVDELPSSFSSRRSPCWRRRADPPSVSDHAVMLAQVGAQLPRPRRQTFVRTVHPQRPSAEAQSAAPLAPCHPAPTCRP